MIGSADVVVVGGGPAGLSSALHARRMGHSVTLLERSERLGGMAASITVAGQRVDLGSHRLHPSASPETRQLLGELLGDDLQRRERKGRLRLADRWVGFPLRAGDLVRNVPAKIATSIATDLATGSRRHEKEGDTYADVVRARLGPTVLQHFHGPYARKLWGVPPEELSGELARRRIGLKNGGDVLDRLRRSSTLDGRLFLYPKRGYGQISERLAEIAAGEGVDIRTATSVLGLRHAGDTVAVSLREGGTIDTSRVFWTAPPGALAAATPDVTLASKPALRHRAVALVYLALAQSRYLPFDAHYVPDPDVPFVRLSEPKNYRDGNDPPDRTVLCAEVPCTVGDATWSASDSDLAMAVLEGMRRLRLPAPPPQAVHVERLPSVYPVLRPEDEEPVAALLATVERIPRVTVLGRQGLAVIDNIHHVLDMARAAAGCLIPDGGWDQSRWDRARARFDTHVVED